MPNLFPALLGATALCHPSFLFRRLNFALSFLVLCGVSGFSSAQAACTLGGTTLTCTDNGPGTDYTTTIDPGLTGQQSVVIGPDVDIDLPAAGDAIVLDAGVTAGDLSVLLDATSSVTTSNGFGILALTDNGNIDIDAQGLIEASNETAPSAAVAAITENGDINIHVESLIKQSPLNPANPSTSSVSFDNNYYGILAWAGYNTDRIATGSGDIIASFGSIDIDQYATNAVTRTGRGINLLAASGDIFVTEVGSITMSSGGAALQASAIDGQVFAGALLNKLGPMFLDGNAGPLVRQCSGYSFVGSQGVAAYLSTVEMARNGSCVMVSASSQNGDVNLEYDTLIGVPSSSGVRTGHGITASVTGNNQLLRIRGGEIAASTGISLQAPSSNVDVLLSGNLIATTGFAMDLSRGVGTGVIEVDGDVISGLPNRPVNLGSSQNHSIFGLVTGDLQIMTEDIVLYTDIGGSTIDLEGSGAWLGNAHIGIQADEIKNIFISGSGRNVEEQLRGVSIENQFGGHTLVANLVSTNAPSHTFIDSFFNVVEYDADAIHVNSDGPVVIDVNQVETLGTSVIDQLFLTTNPGGSNGIFVRSNDIVDILVGDNGTGGVNVQGQSYGFQDIFTGAFTDVLVSGIDVLSQTEDVNVFNSGIIDMPGDGTVAIMAGTTNASSTATVGNSGVINGAANAAILTSGTIFDAIALDLVGAGQGAINNVGTITADNNYTIDGTDQTDTVTNGGDIIGSFAMNGGNDVFRNVTGGTYTAFASTVIGDPDFGSGADFFDNEFGGTFLLGDTGADTLTVRSVDDFRNAGAIILSDGADNDRLIFEGDFQGVASGTIVVDTFVAGETNSSSDVLRIEGSVTGTNQVVVNDLAPISAGDSNQLGIIVIEVEDNTDLGDFTLAGGPIVKGFWSYDLFLDPNDNRVAPSDSVWELRNQRSGAIDDPVRFPYALQSLWAMTIHPWHDRSGDYRPGTATHVGTPGVFDEYEDDDRPYAVWGKLQGGYFERDIGGAPFEQTLFMMETGVDVDFRDVFDDDDRLVVGVMGGLNIMDMTVTDTGTNMSGQMPHLGASLTYLNGGFFLDGVVKAGFYDMDFTVQQTSGALSDTFDGVAWAGSLNAGYRYQKDEHFIEPDAELGFTHTPGEQMTIAGAPINIDDATTYWARAGIRLGTRLDKDEPEDTTWEPMLRASVVHWFGETHTAVVDGTNTAYSPGETYGRLALGIDFAKSDRWSGFAMGEATLGEDILGFELKGSVRYNW